MKRFMTLLAFGLPVLCPAFFSEKAWGQSDLFQNIMTYQGYLKTGGVPANGPYDFRFTLESLSGASNGQDIVNDVEVVDGVFTVELEFGDPNDFLRGRRRFLEIEVREGNSTGPYTLLSPRQELAAAPYSLYSIIHSGRYTVFNDSSAAHLVDIETNGNSSSRALSALHTGLGECGRFVISNAANASTALFAQTNGTGLALRADGPDAVGAANVPDGTMMAVDGKIHCEELEIQLSEDRPDYVFEADYAHMPLEELLR
jgi:hypothetical protein